MSQVRSPSTQQPFGIARVTQVWQVPRSTVYAQRDRRDHPTAAGKRGPKMRWTDAELTARIRTIIAESPFYGEGHRKIWALWVRHPSTHSSRGMATACRSGDPRAHRLAAVIRAPGIEAMTTNGAPT